MLLQMMYTQDGVAPRYPGWAKLDFSWVVFATDYKRKKKKKKSVSIERVVLTTSKDFTKDGKDGRL